MTEKRKTKRVLFVTPVVPLPPTGGGTRSFHLLKAFAKEASVDLFCFQTITADEEKELRLYCNRIISAPATNTYLKRGFFYRFLRKFIFAFPFLFSTKALHDEASFQLNKQLKEAKPGKGFLFAWLFFWLRQRRCYPSVVVQLFSNFLFFKKEAAALPLSNYNVLAVDLSYTFPFFEQLTTHRFPTVIINSHNVEYELGEQSLTSVRSEQQEKWINWQTGLMKQVEQRSLEVASEVFCCSAEDMETFLQLNNRPRYSIVPNGVDLSYFQQSGKRDAVPSLLFTGTMNYFPNSAAVKWFLEEVFVPLRKEMPSLRFMIAGRKADALFQNGLYNGVELIPDPADMRPYFNKASMVVVPLFHGSGTRLKILEAAAMKKPVVSTTLGAAGLLSLTDEMIIFADSGEAFRQAIRELVFDPMQRQQRAEKLYNWVTENYSWEGICANAGEQIRKYLH